MGTEATGLSEIWRKNSTENIIIPMQNNRDTKNIIQLHIRKYKSLKILKFQTHTVTTK